MDTSGTREAVAAPPKRGWRRHSEEFRARVIELARQPNTSVAAVALANGLNANMLRRWVRESEVDTTAVAMLEQFIDDQSARGVQVVLARVHAPVRDYLARVHAERLLAEDSCFPTVRAAAAPPGG